MVKDFIIRSLLWLLFTAAFAALIVFTGGLGAVPFGIGMVAGWGILTAIFFVGIPVVKLLIRGLGGLLAKCCGGRNNVEIDPLLNSQHFPRQQESTSFLNLEMTESAAINNVSSLSPSKPVDEMTLEEAKSWLEILKNMRDKYSSMSANAARFAARVNLDGFDCSQGSRAVNKYSQLVNNELAIHKAYEEIRLRVNTLEMAVREHELVDQAIQHHTEQIEEVEKMLQKSPLNEEKKEKMRRQAMRIIDKQKEISLSAINSSWSNPNDDKSKVSETTLAPETPKTTHKQRKGC